MYHLRIIAEVVCSVSFHLANLYCGRVVHATKLIHQPNRPFIIPSSVPDATPYNPTLNAKHETQKYRCLVNLSYKCLVAPQHAVDQVAQRAPKVLSAGKVVLVDEEHVLLEAGVQMRLQAKLTDDRVVVAVDMGVNTVHALEDLSD